MKTIEDFNNLWEPVLREFIFKYPIIAEQVVDWYPCGQMRILLRLSTGEKKIYDLIDSRLISVGTPIFELDNADDEWKKRFAARLRRKLCITGVTQWELSEKTGISEVTISKYLHGKAIPSAVNVDRIAWALNCDVSDIMRDM